MTRKDYVMIAEAIRDAALEAKDAGLEALIHVETAATYIADGCKRENGRFDRSRFMAACGF